MQRTNLISSFRKSNKNAFSAVDFTENHDNLSAIRDGGHHAMKVVFRVEIRLWPQVPCSVQHNQSIVISINTTVMCSATSTTYMLSVLSLAPV